MGVIDSVLNPSLYRKLTQFGHVKVDRLGQSSNPVVVDKGQGRYRLEFPNNCKGEYYRVCCPFCGDSSYRLNVSYHYGRKDQAGRVINFLARCFNETSCLENEEYRWRFNNMLECFDGISLDQVQVREGQQAVAYQPFWPGEMVGLDELPAGHYAVDYVQKRGFCPATLTKLYGVRYCTFSRLSLAADRLIIPVYHRKVFVGWQARYIGELPWKDKAVKKLLPPKYFTMPQFPKSEFLHNLDRSRHYSCGVVVEGPTDVFSFGDGAVSSFGATLSSAQIELVTSTYRNPDRPIVLMFDPDAWAAPHTLRLLEEPALLGHPGGFARVELPKGTDPGSLSRAYLRDYVKTEARKQKVRVSFKRIPSLT